jgi:hypothetical protein
VTPEQRPYHTVKSEEYRRRTGSPEGTGNGSSRRWTQAELLKLKDWEGSDDDLGIIIDRTAHAIAQARHKHFGRKH